ncbi:MAG: VWA domain-containing protein [Pseudomonadota bacterium]
MPEFANPLFLLLLLLPPLVYLLAPPQGFAGAALIVPESVGRHILAGRPTGATRARAKLLIPSVIWVLLVVALAGPRVLAPQQALPMTGRDLILALDLSGSMIRDDFELNGQKSTRLDVVKTVGAEFARARAGDRVGLVVFGSRAYVAAAPTFDTEAIARAIEGMVIGISGRATNISDAMGIALKRLETSDAETKVIILLSDGANNAGAATPLDVAGLAARMGVRVHTLALGPISREEAPEDRGVVDVKTLLGVAKASGGELFHVRTTDDLRAAARTLDKLEPTARSGLAAETYRSFWIWPALLAGLIALGAGLRQRA